MSLPTLTQSWCICLLGLKNQVHVIILFLIFPSLNHLALILILCPSCLAPGPVGHLSFTEILDTSLKVSWSDPSEKNGILTGTFPLFPI